MNKQHLYITLFMALSSVYLSACSHSVASATPQPDDAKQKQLATERASHLRQTHVRFNALDTNEDGYISREEFKRSGERAFTHLDTNKDGVLSAADPKPEPRGEDTRPEEVRQQQQAQRAEQPRRERLLKMPTTHSVDGMLVMYDSNNDGVVTREEYEAGRAAQFAAVDTNGDGKLSYDEYVAEYASRLDQQIARTVKAD